MLNSLTNFMYKLKTKPGYGVVVSNRHTKKSVLAGVYKDYQSAMNTNPFIELGHPQNNVSITRTRIPRMESYGLRLFYPIARAFVQSKDT